MTGSAPVLVYLLGYNYEIDDLTILRKWYYSGEPKKPSGAISSRITVLRSKSRDAYLRMFSA